MPTSSDAASLSSIDEIRQELANAKSAEKAVGEILKLIGRSPNNLEDVFDTLLDNALRLCDAELGVLFLYNEAEGWRATYLRGVPERFASWLKQGPIKAPLESALGQMEVHKTAVRIEDVKGEDLYREENPLRVATVELGGARSFAAAMRLKQFGVTIGANYRCR